MKPMRSLLLRSALFAVSTLATISAQGATVTLTVDYPNSNSPISTSDTLTLSPTATFTVPGSVTALPGDEIIPFTAVASSTSIDLTFPGSSGVASGSGSNFFNGYVYQFAGGPIITGATLDPSSSFTASQVALSFTPTEVLINLAPNGLPVSILSGDQLNVDLTASPVPIPAAAWLLLSGLGGIGMFARKQRICA